MNDIAKAMLDRIKDAADRGLMDSPATRQSYLENAASAFKAAYGVDLDDVTNLMIPKNDIVWQAAEDGVSIDEFVASQGSRYSLVRLGKVDGEYDRYVSGENIARVALAEFASEDADWTFTDGHAVRADGGASVVISPSYNEARSGWQFTACSAACGVDQFIALPASAKASMTVPTEARVYGDIGECGSLGRELEAAGPAASM
jgi:hypothetical protein